MYIGKYTYSRFWKKQANCNQLTGYEESRCPEYGIEAPEHPTGKQHRAQHAWILLGLLVLPLHVTQIQAVGRGGACLVPRGAVGWGRLLRGVQVTRRRGWCQGFRLIHGRDTRSWSRDPWGPFSKSERGKTFKFNKTKVPGLRYMYTQFKGDSSTTTFCRMSTTF